MNAMAALPASRPSRNSIENGGGTCALLVHKMVGDRRAVAKHAIKIPHGPHNFGSVNLIPRAKSTI